jgi:LacI family transcriptional regulator
VDQPSHEMGSASFYLLLEEMNCHKDGTVFKPRTIELNTSIIQRESSAR